MHTKLLALLFFDKFEFLKPKLFFFFFFFLSIKQVGFVALNINRTESKEEERERSKTKLDTGILFLEINNRRKHFLEVAVLMCICPVAFCFLSVLALLFIHVTYT